MTLLLMLATLRPYLCSTPRPRPCRLPHRSGAPYGLGEVSGGSWAWLVTVRFPGRLRHARGARCARHLRRAPIQTTPTHQILPDLLAESDIVSLHLPLTSETIRIIGAEHFVA